MRFRVKREEFATKKMENSITPIIVMYDILKNGFPFERIPLARFVYNE